MQVYEQICLAQCLYGMHYGYSFKTKKYYVVPTYMIVQKVRILSTEQVVGIYHYQRCIRPPRLMMLASTLLSSLLLILDRAEGGNFWPRKQHFDSTVNFWVRLWTERPPHKHIKFRETDTAAVVSTIIASKVVECVNNIIILKEK